MAFFSFEPSNNGSEEFRVSKLYWVYSMYNTASTIATHLLFPSTNLKTNPASTLLFRSPSRNNNPFNTRRHRRLGRMAEMACESEG